MRSARSPPAALILLLSGVVLGRVVRVPSGPLLRVEGTDVSISCNVSDYEGPREQNFEWIFSSGVGPAEAVLSTWDHSFTHGSYMERVKSGGVQLRRTGNSEVLLHIRHLSRVDEGNYSCSTPSTDATVSGNYEAHVQLKVIADTLRLHVPKGRRTSVRNVTEGGTFQLPCLASFEDAATHVHLSLTWQLQSGGSTSDVLTLTHLGRLQPGTEYAARYNSGDLRVDTAVSDTYQLIVDAAQPWDAGEYSCVARTWVQGADGWEKIQEKQVDVARVEVRPIGLKVTVEKLTLEVPQGNPFTLSCQVSVDSSVPLITQVRWFHAHSGALHQVPSGPDPDPATEIKIHELLVPQAWDSGEYICQASTWTLLGNGTWHQVAEEKSPPIRVQVTHEVSDLQVSLNLSVAPQMAEKPSELWCHVSGAPHLSVSWYFTPSQKNESSTVSPVLVGSLHQDGSLQGGQTYQQRMEKGELILSRRGPQTFVLRIQWTSEEDRGLYHCTGTSWKQLRSQSWTPAAEATSAPISLFWTTEGSSIVVDARVIKMVSAAGGTFEMICTVQAQNLLSPQYSVRVTRRPPQENAAPVTVLTLDHGGVIHRTTVSNTVLEKGKEGAYLFRLYQAQNQDVGMYQCEIVAWMQGGGGAWRMAQNKTTHPVLLEFQTLGPVFNVSARSDRLSVYLGDRSEFWCIITIDGPALDPDDMAFDVSWFVQRPGGSSVFLAAADRSAQVRHNRNSSSEVSLERVSDMEYRLRVYGCNEDDAGGHYCTVTPWVRSGKGGWSQQETITSDMMSLNVKMDLLSAFRYPLLMGVGLSLLAGLLSCLIGYCSSRFCCKAPPVQEKRREHRRLMSMEMD